MSLPSISITCSKCAFKAAHAPGVFSYVYECPDGSKVNAPTALGWCAKCKTIATIQLGLSQRQLKQVIRDLEVRIGDKRKGFLVSKNDKALIECLNGEVAEQRGLMSALGNAYTLDRCIACGSTDVVGIDIPLRPVGNQPLQVAHPLCGGELLAKEGPRFNLRSEEKKLSLDHAQAITSTSAEDAEGDMPSPPPLTMGLTRFQSVWTALFSIGPALIVMTKSFWLGAASYFAIMLLNGALGWVGVATVPMERLALFGYVKNALVGCTVLAIAWAFAS